MTFVTLLRGGEGGGQPTGRNVTAHAVTLWGVGGSRQECDCDTGLRMAQRDLTQCESQPCSQPCCQPCSQSRSKRASQPASQPAVTITSSGGGGGGRAQREKCDKHLRHIEGGGGSETQGDRCHQNLLSNGPNGRPSGRPTAGRQVGLDRGRRPGGQRNGRFGGQRPPTENLNDFHDDFRPGGRAPAGEAGGKKSKNTITTTKPTTY